MAMLILVVMSTKPRPILNPFKGALMMLILDVSTRRVSDFSVRASIVLISVVAVGMAATVATPIASEATNAVKNFIFRVCSDRWKWLVIGCKTLEGLK